MYARKSEKKTKDQHEAEMAELRYILQMKPELRSEEQCQIVCDFMIKGKFLKRVKNNEDFRELARYIYLKKFQENTIVFNEGDDGNAFYIILEGKVNLNSFCYFFFRH